MNYTSNSIIMSDEINITAADDDNISDDNDFISISDNDSDEELQRFRRKSKSIEWKLVERLTTKERIDSITVGYSYCYSLKLGGRVLK